MPDQDSSDELLPGALADCLVMNTVAAARALLRRHDAQLKPYGVTVQQFALLGAVRANPGASIGVLAERVSLDRTSLTRNLDLLERKGLVRRVEETTGNLRLCELTELGGDLLGQLLPEWRKAQNALMNSITATEAQTYLRVARRLAQG